MLNNHNKRFKLIQRTEGASPPPTRTSKLNDTLEILKTDIIPLIEEYNKRIKEVIVLLEEYNKDIKNVI